MLLIYLWFQLSFQLPIVVNDGLNSNLWCYFSQNLFCRCNSWYQISSAVFCSWSSISISANDRHLLNFLICCLLIHLLDDAFLNDAFLNDAFPCAINDGVPTTSFSWYSTLAWKTFSYSCSAFDGGSFFSWCCCLLVIGFYCCLINHILDDVLLLLACILLQILMPQHCVVALFLGGGGLYDFIFSTTHC